MKYKFFTFVFLVSALWLSGLEKPIAPHRPGRSQIKNLVCLPAAKNTFYGIDLQKMQTASTPQDIIDCWRQLFSLVFQTDLKYIPQASSLCADDRYDYQMSEEQRAQTLQIFSKN